MAWRISLMAAMRRPDMISMRALCCASTGTATPVIRSGSGRLKRPCALIIRPEPTSQAVIETGTTQPKSSSMWINALPMSPPDRILCEDGVHVKIVDQGGLRRSAMYPPPRESCGRPEKHSDPKVRSVSNGIRSRC